MPIKDKMTTEEIFTEEAWVIAESCDNLEKLMKSIHKLNKQWWDFDRTNSPTRNVGEAIALMHSELSEALEGYRKELKDEHLPGHDSLTVEMADTIIRILDFCQGFNLPVADAIFGKLKYNASRADHKLENRMKEGGKKF